MKRAVQSLNGVCDYRIADGEYTQKIVPYSDLSVGFAECRFDFYTMHPYSSATGRLMNSAYLLPIDADKSRRLTQVSVKVENNAYNLLIYGVTLG